MALLSARIKELPHGTASEQLRQARETPWRINCKVAAPIFLHLPG
jgi:hypothetical protein